MKTIKFLFNFLIVLIFLISCSSGGAGTTATDTEPEEDPPVEIEQDYELFGFWTDPHKTREFVFSELGAYYTDAGYFVDKPDTVIYNSMEWHTDKAQWKLYMTDRDTGQEYVRDYYVVYYGHLHPDNLLYMKEESSSTFTLWEKIVY